MDIMRMIDQRLNEFVQLVDLLLLLLQLIEYNEQTLIPVENFADEFDGFVQFSMNGLQLIYIEPFQFVAAILGHFREKFNRMVLLTMVGHRFVDQTLRAETFEAFHTVEFQRTIVVPLGAIERDPGTELNGCFGEMANLVEGACLVRTGRVKMGVVSEARLTIILLTLKASTE